ncbi:MAG: glycosidase [Actinomycetota bacterium]|nr:glycosidase [Actinomycetota bacterium]
MWTDPALQVVTVHNPGAATVGDETVLLFRSHLRCGISVLGLARSVDGIREWRIDSEPALVPADGADLYGSGVDKIMAVEMESGGVEDARVNPVDGTFAVAYSAYHGQIAHSVQVCLATTDDLKSFTRYGPILSQDMRNVVIFPERIGGRYVALLRPNGTASGQIGGAYTQIRVAYADDFRAGPWIVDDQPIMSTGHGPSSFSDKIGPGAPPVRTRHGWLNLFHGVRTTLSGNRYVLGVALHDLHDVRRVHMSSIPIVFPTAADCRTAETDYVHVPGVVFSCGMLRRSDGSLIIYYAGADTVVNVAVSHEDVLAELCLRYSQDPLTGTLRNQPWHRAIHAR